MRMENNSNVYYQDELLSLFLMLKTIKTFTVAIFGSYLKILLLKVLILTHLLKLFFDKYVQGDPFHILCDPDAVGNS
jgi:hypothetical protein